MRKTNREALRFAIACKPKACVPPQAGFARLGLFAVGYLMCPHPTKTQNTFGHIFLKTLGKFLKPTSNPHYYKKTEFWKKCVQTDKTLYTAIFRKKPGLQRFSWTRPVFRTCPKHPAKNEMETSWTGMQNTTCPNSTLMFHGE